MKCPRCNNTDMKYFHKGSKGWYCRRCISFGRMLTEQENKQVQLSAVNSDAQEYVMHFDLTARQKEISRQCAQLIEKGNVLLHCVCGAGKTELVLESISSMLAKGKKVCFAIPRRQVVLELKDRLSSYFPKAKVVAVCGGHTDKTDGDLIICTTHQLYRYYRAFDLLILDEPDAFPYKGNEVLQAIASNCYRQSVIYLTATPDCRLLEMVRRNELNVLQLNRRPHGYPLCVPLAVYGGKPYLLMRCLLWIRKQIREKKPVILFVPSKNSGKLMNALLSRFCGSCFICSDTPDKDALISQFRQGKYPVCVATTVLERGVTIPRVNVAVWRADHRVFDEASLNQIAGRVGRSFDCPQGECLFLAESRSIGIDGCLKAINEANSHE